jgi:hypothetical protein
LGYEIYGLTDNPFPKGGAIIKPGSKDPRENGKIFSVNAREKEISEFRDRFLGAKTSFSDRLRCGFLWAEGSTVSGRGMGKTALALYMKHQINDGFGKNFFNGKAKFFCAYLAFQQQLKAKVAYLYKECLRSMITEGIFQEISRSVSQEDLVKSGVSVDFAEAITKNEVKKYLEDRSRYKLDEMSTLWDQKFLIKLPKLFLTETVLALQAAGFAGGLLVIDDMENLTDQSTRGEIENFVKNVGLAFLRADNEASNSGFFTLIFTTHENSAQRISQAWTVAGLAPSFPLSPKGRASVLTRKPDIEQCLDIISEHLKFFRTDSQSTKATFTPFTKAAVELVIQESDYHPRRFLSRMSRIIIEAIGNDIKEITPEFVRKVPEVEEEPTQTAGLEQL